MFVNNVSDKLECIVDAQQLYDAQPFTVHIVVVVVTIALLVILLGTCLCQHIPLNIIYTYEQIRIILMNI